jgi:VWFA-related protein
MSRILITLGLTLLLAAPVVAQIQPQHPPAPADQNGKPPATPSVPQQGSSQPPNAQAPAGDQQRPGAVPPSDTRARIVSRTELVLVPVTVKDTVGRLIGDLRREDFRVFDDGVEQQIVLFSSDPFPLSAVILIDNDLTNKQAEQVQKSLTAIAAGFGPADEAAVVTYDQFPHVVSEFSFNNDLLYTQLKRLEINSHYPGSVAGPMAAGPMINGQSQATGVPQMGARNEAMDKSMDDAIYSAGEMLKGRGRDRRKLIFLISDGNNSRQNHHSFGQTLHFLLEADVSVYSISVGHALLQHETGRLEKYAMATGGDTFYAGKALELSRLYARVTEQARNQYTLTFSPKGADPHRDYHTLEVRVRRPELDIRTRDGYYTSAVGAPR